MAVVLPSNGGVRSAIVQDHAHRRCPISTVDVALTCPATVIHGPGYRLRSKAAALLIVAAGLAETMIVGSLFARRRTLSASGRGDHAPFAPRCIARANAHQDCNRPS